MKTVTQIMIIFLFIYAIVGDFIVGVFGFGSIRIISLAGFVLFFGFYLAMKWDGALIRLLIAVLALVGVYIIIRGELFKGFTAVYCIPLGCVVAKEWRYCSPYLDFLFCVQFVLLLYEAITGSFIYQEIDTGIINAQSTNFDADVQMVRALETGFRTKGFFAGTLTASSFVVYYSYLNKDNKLKLFFSLLMALIIKGRFAVLSVFLLFAYTCLNSLKRKYDKSIFYSALIVGGIIVLILFVGLISISGSVPFVYNLLHVFDFNGDANLGRIWAYTQALNTFLNDYGVTQKLLGGTYELLDQYGRTGVSSESEFLGQLLEIGLIGTAFYIVAFYKLFRHPRNAGVSLKFVALMMLAGYLEYRHCAGTLRTMLFWSVFFLYSRYYGVYERVRVKRSFNGVQKKTVSKVTMVS